MTAVITTLIDRPDGFEVVRDKIAVILAEEFVNQRALAVTAAKPDPDLWKVRVFLERNAPWEEYENLDEASDRSPLCNVTYFESRYDDTSGNRLETQASISTYWIDCYGYGQAAADGSGHQPGDEDSALVATRAARLVRSILMAGQYRHLGLQGTVTDRKPIKLTLHRPSPKDAAIQHISIMRFELEVRHSELSPQVVEGLLTEINATIKRSGTGEVYAELNYQ